MKRNKIMIISLLSIFGVGLIFLTLFNFMTNLSLDTNSPVDVQNKQEQPNNENLERQEYTLSTIAGSGEFSNQLGDRFAGSFRMPGAVLVIDQDEFIISDTWNHQLKHFVNNQLSVYAGMDPLIVEENDGLPEGYYFDDTLDTSFFNHPLGATMDDKGNIYIADAGNHAIRKIDQNGQVTTFAGNGVLGLVDGKGIDAHFFHPTDIVIADNGTMFVADSLNHVIRSISPQGEVSTLTAPSTRVVELTDGIVSFAGDYLDGSIDEAKFNEPSGLALDEKGNLYVSDSGNQLIRYINFEKNNVTTVAGTVQEIGEELYVAGGDKDGEALEASFHFPKGIAINSDGKLFIADSMNHTIRLLANGQVRTIAGQSLQYGLIDGKREENMLYLPSYISILPNEDLIIADTNNQVIRKLTAVQPK